MIVDKIKKESEHIQREARAKVLGYITAGFGVVAGFAWNDAIKSLIEFLFPLQKNTVSAKFIYALVLTVVLVAITTYLLRIFKGEENE